MSKVERVQVSNPREELKKLIKGLIGKGEFVAEEFPWVGSGDYLLTFFPRVNSRGQTVINGSAAHLSTIYYSSEEECMADFEEMKAEIKKDKARKEKTYGAK